MDPIAFSIPQFLGFGPFDIRWYGIMMSLSMVLGAWIAQKLLRKAGYKGDLIWDALFYIIIFSIIGARLVYVLTNLGDYASNPLEVLRIDHGGLAFHGGIVGGGLAAYFFFRRQGVPFLAVADSFVPGVCLGIVLVRIGNILNGDILGYKWNGPWAMNFPYDEYHYGLEPGAIVLRHPAEIYGLLVGVICVATGFLTWRYTYLAKRAVAGTTFMWFMISYSVVRSVLEDPFRAVPLLIKLTDPAQVGFGILTTSQIASIPFIVLGFWGLKQLPRWFAHDQKMAEAGLKAAQQTQATTNSRQQVRAAQRKDEKQSRKRSAK